MDHVQTETTGDEPVVRQASTYEDLAGMIELPLLDPLMPEEAVAARCEMARRYRLAAITVRPSDVQLVSKWLSDSRVAVGTVIGSADGSQTTAVKNYETRDLIGRGAREVCATMNLAKLFSRQFQYLELEVAQLWQECRDRDTRLKITIELPLLPQDLRVIACKILKRAEAKHGRAAWRLSPAPATDADLEFLKLKFGENITLDAGAVESSLDRIKALYAMGVARVVVRDPVTVLEQWKKELEARAAAARLAAQSPPSEAP